MSIEAKANLVLARARELESDAKSWTEFSNALFDQTKGLVAQTFENPMERQAFYDSPQYKEANAILLGLMKRFGVKAGAAPAPEKSGRILVRIPRTIHNSLEIEAKREGVSLNQLAVSKLSVPLRSKVKLDYELLRQAYVAVYGGYASDRVVVDPELNANFLAQCRSLGLTQSDYAINHALFDARKSKKFELPKTTKTTVFHDYDDYQFGTEIAARILQRTEGVTLDHILCDPDIRRRFDDLCKPLVQERMPLKLHYAVLNLRKTRRLSPEDVATGPMYDLLTAGPVRKIDLSQVPTFQATYAFYDQNRPIFAGETENLRKRIGIHLEPGRLPDWIDVRDPSFTLRYFVATSAHQSDRLKWLRSFINAERPLLNYQEVA